MSKAEPHSLETRQKAFDLWIKHGKCTLEELRKHIMAEMGIVVDKSMLSRWKDSIPAWANAYLEIPTGKGKLDPAKILKALKSAKDDAKSLEPDHFQGVKAQLVARLYVSIQELPIASVEDWERALSCCDKIEALIHAERGKAVIENRQAPGSLMTALSPPLKIAPFKKPNGNGAA